ncbi:THAP domain-containing protein 10-like [Dendronephthya gigantea]|uniref:THAP domain-containing protein 10-like n=1 Tax=Dendronephthya gigantea TaxID=151771 RepID=UPI00106AB1AE|nr:THAP domain-containing protein 10-like [Dendronephthya gigantea]
MPERCVVYGCNNTANSEKGISLYRIPYWDDSRQIARARRKKWEDFIRRKRDKWLPSASSVVCSKHFAEECFDYGSSTVEKYKTPKLKRDKIGVTAVPSLLPEATSFDSERTMRLQRRGKRVLEGPPTVEDPQPSTSTNR